MQYLEGKRLKELEKEKAKQCLALFQQVTSSNFEQFEDISTVATFQPMVWTIMCRVKANLASVYITTPRLRIIHLQQVQMLVHC